MISRLDQEFISPFGWHIYFIQWCMYCIKLIIPSIYWSPIYMQRNDKFLWKQENMRPVSEGNTACRNQYCNQEDKQWIDAAWVATAKVNNTSTVYRYHQSDFVLLLAVVNYYISDRLVAKELQLHKQTSPLGFALGNRFVYCHNSLALSL